jgi:lysyl-tRNA synthetase class 2
LQRLYGGAFAKPFETHHNAMDMKLYLRIATELYLKRVIIGGIDKVYEIGKDFRNEGIDRMHNPEFTMIEIYQAFADYNDMMDLTENFVKYIADKTTGTLKIDYQGTTTELTKPFARISFWEIIEQRTGRNLRNASRDQLIAYLDEQHIEFDPKASDYVLVDEIFKERVERTLIEPTFIIDYPLELSPLAKRKSGTKSIVERFEFFWYGFEIANAFTELNDPIDQRARFEEQMKLRAKGNLEAQVMDEDFLTAIEHGMPPTAGMGMGIDRIVMILTNSYSLKDVILFPLQRPLK